VKVSDFSVFFLPHLTPTDTFDKIYYYINMTYFIAPAQKFDNIYLRIKQDKPDK